jgi:hypothetical protein
MTLIDERSSAWSAIAKSSVRRHGTSTLFRFFGASGAKNLVHVEARTAFTGFSTKAGNQRLSARSYERRVECAWSVSVAKYHRQGSW